jgi:tripartite-type tricarboxylate transporter receptor subunit TctC
VPTFEEHDIPGLVMGFWHGLWAPKGTPADVIATLNGAARAAFADATVKQRYIEMGQEMPSPAEQSPAALAAFHKGEIDKWWPIIKAANIKVQ